MTYVYYVISPPYRALYLTRRLDDASSTHDLWSSKNGGAWVPTGWKHKPVSAYEVVLVASDLVEAVEYIKKQTTEFANVDERIAQIEYNHTLVKALNKVCP